MRPSKIDPDTLTLAGALEEMAKARPYIGHTHRTPSAILVLRTKDGRSAYTSLVWTGKSPRDVLARALATMHKKRKRKSILWTDPLDEFIEKFYGSSMSTTEIAKHLRGMSRQPFTKNTVISRYHRIIKWREQGGQGT